MHSKHVRFLNNPSLKLRTEMHRRRACWIHTLKYVRGRLASRCSLGLINTTRDKW